MSDRVTIILPDDLSKELEEVQNSMQIDKSSLIRQLISKGIKDWKIDRALEDLKKGKISFGKAVIRTGVTYWELLDICHERKISLNISQEDIDKGFKIIGELEINNYLDKFKNTSK